MRCRASTEQHDRPPERHRATITRDEPRAVVGEAGHERAEDEAADRSTQTVITISSVLAALPDESPRPCTRNGNPHSSAKTVGENCEVKCDHIPSRVPGLPHTRLSVRRRARILIRARASRR